MPQTYKEEEINLTDYLKVIIKRKQLIIAVFLISVISAAIFCLVYPKHFKVDTVLELGVISDEIIEGSKQLKEKIDSDVFGIVIRAKLGISERDYPDIKIRNPEDTRLINIIINSSSETEESQKILEEMNNMILVEHQEIIKEKMDLIENDINFTENKIRLTEANIELTKNKMEPIIADIQRIENKIENTKDEERNLEAKVEALERILVYQQDPGTQFALFDSKEKLAQKRREIEDLYMTINSLTRGKEDLEMQINSLNTEIENLNTYINTRNVLLADIKPTEIIKPPSVSEKPTMPRPAFYTAIAGILGIFFGIFWAFIRESWEKNK